jgi:hypothetical protein
MACAGTMLRTPRYAISRAKEASSAPESVPAATGVAAECGLNCL